MPEEVKKAKGEQEKPKVEVKGKEKEGQKFKSKDEPVLTRPKVEKKIQIVRVAETDLNGALAVFQGIKKIKGVSFMLANAVSQVCPFSDKKIVDLSDKEITDLEDIIHHPEKYSIPNWLFNRRRDPETNQTSHLIASQLQFITGMDINKLKKMRSYKGIRHGLGLPVRGQRTKSSGRKKSGSVGVKRKKEEPKVAPAGGIKK